MLLPACAITRQISKHPRPHRALDVESAPRQRRVLGAECSSEPVRAWGDFGGQNSLSNPELLAILLAVFLDRPLIAIKGTCE